VVRKENKGRIKQGTLAKRVTIIVEQTETRIRVTSGSISVVVVVVNTPFYSGFAMKIYFLHLLFLKHNQISFKNNISFETKFFCILRKYKNYFLTQEIRIRNVIETSYDVKNK